MNHLFEHPTGVFLHVQYVPATSCSKPVLQDVRLAAGDYEPIGPNLLSFLHNTYSIDTTGAIGMATPLLELISLDLP